APHVIDVLNTTFGNSPSMAQTFIRDPLLVYWIEDDRVLFRRTNRKALTASLKASLHAVTSFEARCEALRRFKRREMLRIGIRDLLGIATTVETYTVLSDLASAVIQSAYELVDRNLKHRVGRVEGFSANQHPFRAFSVLAMGKLGGWELNYSSDVDLVYVYQASSGQRTKNHARNGISCAEYYEMLARDL